MILLVTPINRRTECAAALQEAMGEPVMIAEDLLRATLMLRSEDVHRSRVRSVAG